MTLGRFIRTQRADMSLRSLARLIGVTPSYLSDIENDRRVPAETVMRAIATALDLSFNALMVRAGRSPGAALIVAERERQTAKLGWDTGHDDAHRAGDLALVAALYATPRPLTPPSRDPFPWRPEHDKRPTEWDGSPLPNETLKPTDRIRQLAKAGALIAAEIDRLQRALDEAEATGE